MSFQLNENLERNRFLMLTKVLKNIHIKLVKKTIEEINKNDLKKVVVSREEQLGVNRF